ncbi:MAG: PAC2 family protein [Candidatus Helarchaeales archaeon]
MMIKCKDLEVNLEEIKDSLIKPIVLIGFPGIAMVGKLAVLNIAKTLNAVPARAIYFSDFPPQAIISQEGFMQIPKATINLARDVGEQDVLIISADFQPISQAGIYQFSDYICKSCKEMNVQTVISTGAFVPQGQITSERKVYVSGTSKKIIEFLLESKSARTVLFKGGYITGANGVIPAWASIHYGMDGACLLADALSMLQFDPKASKTLVQVISERFNLPMNVEDLDREIENIEVIATQLTEAMKQEKKDPKFQPYFG